VPLHNDLLGHVPVACARVDEADSKCCAPAGIVLAQNNTRWHTAQVQLLNDKSITPLINAINNGLCERFGDILTSDEYNVAMMLIP